MHLISHSPPTSQITNLNLLLPVQLYPLAFLGSFFLFHTTNKQVLILQRLQFYKYVSSHIM